MTIKQMCDDAGPCAFHEDGAPEHVKCPGMCDAEGCRALGDWVLCAAPIPLAEDPTHFCGHHLSAEIRYSKT